MNIPTKPLQFNPGIGFEALEVSDDDPVFGDEFVAPAPPAVPLPTPAPRAPARPAPYPSKLSVGNILDRARERLAELKTELAAAAILQIEHDKLERLLAAADALEP